MKVTHWTTSIYGLRIEFDLDALTHARYDSEIPILLHSGTGEPPRETKTSSFHLKSLIQSFGLREIPGEQNVKPV